MNIDLLAEVARVLDQHRRNICQEIAKAKGETSHMYYEGQRVGLQCNSAVGVGVEQRHAAADRVGTAARQGDIGQVRRQR